MHENLTKIFNYLIQLLLLEHRRLVYGRTFVLKRKVVVIYDE